MIFGKIPYLAKLISVFWFGIAAIAAPLCASEAVEVSYDQLLAEDFTSVYEASKYDQKVTPTPPASMGVVTGDEIKKYGYRTFGEIVASLKGFYNTNDRNYGYVGARGFGLPSDYNTRLLLLIDGHRFNDNIYDSFDSTEGFPVDVDMIERVEIARGPSSSLYGTSAFFGVINIITKRGRDLAGFNVKGSYGSNNAYKTSVSGGKRFASGLEAFVAGSFFDNEGYSHLYYPEYDKPANNNGIADHHDAEQAKKLLATLSYQDFTLQALYVNRYKEVPTATFASVFNSDLATTRDQSTFIDLKYDHTYTNQLNLKARVSYNNYRYTSGFPYNLLESGTNLSDLVVSKDIARGQWWRAEATLSKMLWDSHKMTAGLEFQQNFDQFQSNYDVQTNLSVQTNTYKWALLWQDDYAITNNLTFNTGVRFDSYNNFGETINPRAGFIYSPWLNTNFKLLYGTAFRAPNQYEQNYSGLNANIANPNLKPEKLQTFEFIVEQYLTKQLRTEVNLYYNQIRDIIALNDIDISGQASHQLQNMGRVNSVGVEAQLEGNWVNGWQSRLSYSWQDTRDQKTKARLINSPEHMVKLNLIAPLLAERIFLGFETQYMSARKTIEGRVDDYIVNNLSLFTKNWVKGLELSAGAYNLFDQRYFDPASHNHLQNGIQQDGLTFRLKASLDF